MARNPELLRAIRTHPDDDTVRLVYADWLQENGDEAHADLIRVQCELARKPKPKRRADLQKREAELLADPAFHFPGERPFVYARGFVSDTCSVSLSSLGAGFTALDEDWGAEPNPFAVMLTAKHRPVLDRVSNLRLDLAGLHSPGPKWNAPPVVEVLRRVTALECHTGRVEPRVFDRLVKCKHFESATTLVFSDATEVQLDRVAELALSDALPHLNHIHLDGEEWTTGHDNEVEDEDLAAFVARLDAHARAERLRHLQLHWPVGPFTAEALLSATRLKPDHLLLPYTKGLRPTAKAALKKKFGTALAVRGAR